MRVVPYPYILVIDKMEMKWETGILSTKLISQARIEQLHQLSWKSKQSSIPWPKVAKGRV